MKTKAYAVLTLCKEHGIQFNTAFREKDEAQRVGKAIQEMFDKKQGKNHIHEIAVEECEIIIPDN